MPSVNLFISAFFICVDMNDFLLSKFGNLSLKQSPVNEMTASFSKTFRPGVDINLGVGYVNDETIPHSKLEECFSYVLSHTDEYKNSLNYGSANGSQNLIQAIRKYYLDNSIGGITKELLQEKTICVGANGATSILDAFAAIMPKGIVITAEPNYYIYTETLARNGFCVMTVPEDIYGMRTDALKDLLTQINTDDLSFVYIVTVNNPSSIILSNKRRKEIVEIIAKLSKQLKRKIPVIFDKAYEDIIFDTTIELPISGLVYDKEGLVFELGTLSKAIAPALRIGYMIGTASNLMTALIQKTSDIGFSASLINEEITARFLDVYINNHLKEVRLGYAKKAHVLQKMIHEHLDEYLESVSGGQAGFYFYLTFKTIETHSKSSFFKYLSRETGQKEIDGYPEKHPRLIYVPGEFCVSQDGSLHEKGNRQLRLAYGFEDIQILEKSVILLEDAAKYAMSLKQ